MAVQLAILVEEMQAGDGDRRGAALVVEVRGEERVEPARAAEEQLAAVRASEGALGELVALGMVTADSPRCQTSSLVSSELAVV